MSYAVAGSALCKQHHLEDLTRRRSINRRRGLCGCGAQPDPGYRTCAWCRTWATWRKKGQRHPELRLVYETQQFCRAYLEHGCAARAAREAKLGTGPGAARKGYRLLQKTHIRARLEELKAAIINSARRQADDDARVAALTREVERDSLDRVELAALLDLEAAEARELKLLKRIRREVRPSMDRGGSRGAAHNRGSRGLVTVLSSAEAFSVSSGGRR